MKKLIKDEMNIKDIMNPINHNELIYGNLSNTNIIELTYSDETFPDIYSVPGIDYFNNEYVIVAVDKSDGSNKKIYLKEIPIKEHLEEIPIEE